MNAVRFASAGLLTICAFWAIWFWFEWLSNNWQPNAWDYWAKALLLTGLLSYLISSVAMSWRHASRCLKRPPVRESPRVRTYEKAKWSAHSCAEEGVPESRAFVYGGMLFGWLARRSLLSAEYNDESLVSKIVEKKITGPQLFETHDGVLSSELVNSEGTKFLDFYLRKYSKDFQKCFSVSEESIHHVADTWENFEKLSLLLDSRFEKWKSDSR